MEQHRAASEIKARVCVFAFLFLCTVVRNRKRLWFSCTDTRATSKNVKRTRDDEVMSDVDSSLLRHINSGSPEVAAIQTRVVQAVVKV